LTEYFSILYQYQQEPVQIAP